MGAGFLVGPDVLITNYHVIKDVIRQPGLAARVVLRFDYEKVPNGATLNPGTEFHLAADCCRSLNPDQPDAVLLTEC